MQEKNATAVADVNRFRIDRGEHSLEGGRHQLQRLVILGEVVQHQHRGVEEGGLCITRQEQPNSCINSLAVEFEDVATERIFLDLGVKGATNTQTLK